MYEIGEDIDGRTPHVPHAKEGFQCQYHAIVLAVLGMHKN